MYHYLFNAFLVNVDSTKSTFTLKVHHSTIHTHIHTLAMCYLLIRSIQHLSTLSLMVQNPFHLRTMTSGLKGLILILATLLQIIDWLTGPHHLQRAEM